MELLRDQGELSQVRYEMGNEPAWISADERAAAVMRALANNITDVETRLTYLKGCLAGTP